MHGKGPMGEGPAGEGPGRGAHGMHPMGMPGQRFDELIAKEKAGTLTDQEKAQLEQLRKVHTMHMVRREVRMKALREKEKAGTLTDAEKGELAKITQIQTRFEGLKAKYTERVKDRQKRRHEAKRLALQIFPDAGKNPTIRAEFIKHSKRLAMLERAREVADASERTELVARIDQLLEKENKRHQAWVIRQKKADKAESEKGATP